MFTKSSSRSVTKNDTNRKKAFKWLQRATKGNQLLQIPSIAVFNQQVEGCASVLRRRCFAYEIKQHVDLVCKNKLHNTENRKTWGTSDSKVAGMFMIFGVTPLKGESEMHFWMSNQVLLYHGQKAPISFWAKCCHSAWWARMVFSEITFESNQSLAMQLAECLQNT